MNEFGLFIEFYYIQEMKQMDADANIVSSTSGNRRVPAAICEMDFASLLDNLPEVAGYDDIDVFDLRTIWRVGPRLSEIPSDESDDNAIREMFSSQHGPDPSKHGGSYEVSLPSLYMRTSVNVPLPFPSANHVAKWLITEGGDEDVDTLEQYVIAVCNGTKVHYAGYRFEWANINYTKYFQGMLGAKTQAELIQRNAQQMYNLLEDQRNVLQDTIQAAERLLTSISLGDDEIEQQVMEDYIAYDGRSLPEGHLTDEALSRAENMRRAQSSPNPNDI